MSEDPKFRSIDSAFPAPPWRRPAGQPNEQNLRVAQCLSHAFESYRAGRIRLAIQHVAAAVDLITGTWPEHDFEIEPFFAYALQGHRPSNIAALRDEVKRTFALLYTYGENVAITYERAAAGLSTMDLFADSAPLMREIHSASTTATFTDVIRCGGTYARQRYCVYFRFYEMQIAPSHLAEFERLDAAIAGANLRDAEAMNELAGQPLTMLRSYALTPHAELARTQILNASSLMLNFVKTSLYALRVSGDDVTEVAGDSLAMQDELTTHPLLEPILEAGDRRVCFVISPTRNPVASGSDPDHDRAVTSRFYEQTVQIEIVVAPRLTAFRGFDGASENAAV